LAQPAIIENGRVLDYDGVLRAVRSVAAALAGLRIGPGSRVALALPNGADFVGSFFAVAHMGALVVPLNPSLQQAEMAAVMSDAQVSAVLSIASLRERSVSALRAAVGLGEEAAIVLDDPKRCADMSSEQPGAHGWPKESAEPSTPLLCLYSSGSTGRPKRIVRTHANILYEIDCLRKRFALSGSDRMMGVAPFSHTNGLMRSMISSLLSGATLLPLPQFERRAVARMIEKQRATVFIGVPFMFAMLAEARWPAPVDFSSLRLCVCASAPLTRDTFQRFHERYGIHVRQLYGTTETGSISVNMSPRPEDAFDSLGTPYDGVTVEIFSPERRVLPAGEHGEIGIKSLGATREYAGSAEATAAAFSDGYFFPGDIGYKDAGGAIYLVGRKSLFINRGGYKVNPYEIENLIQTHPKVQDVAAIGVDTGYGDQKIKAVVVATEALEEGEIIDFCRGKVADFKIPSIVEFRQELPKSSTGKLLRKLL
jgi:long-chain acyl-CoA synthetase